MRPGIKGIYLVWLLSIVTVLVVVGVWLLLRPPTLTEEEVRQAIVTTIQREEPASFFVTGALEVTATTTVENTKYFLPNFFRLDMGTTKAVVRMPGRVSYGFEMDGLRPEMITLGEDGVIDVALPPLEVYSVEPRLEDMEIQTEVGWARSHARSGQRVEQRALSLVRRALQEQGRAHLAGSAQPRINTAEALSKLLTPVLEAAGLQDPRFRFYIDEQLVLEPEG